MRDIKPGQIYVVKDLDIWFIPVKGRIESLPVGTKFVVESEALYPTWVDEQQKQVRIFVWGKRGRVMCTDFHNYCVQLEDPA